MKMTEYQRRLVEEHLGIVDWVIRCRIKVTGQPLLSYEDFYQIGCEALCRAAMQYDPKRGSFEPFGSRYVYNAMISHCRKENSHTYHAANLSVDEDGDPCLFRTLGEEPDFESGITSALLREILAEYRKQCSGIMKRGVEAIELKSLGYSTREIAKRYGTTVNNVNAWISRARSRLRSDPRLLEFGI